VTDPPAGISFMGKLWDTDHGHRDKWVQAFAAIFAECIRVLKPGTHGFVWALPRTSHWTTTALEDAGFEIRDVVTHHFGSGFPKSLNLGNGWGTALKPATEHWILVRKPLSEKNVAANVERWGVGGINVDGGRVGTGGPTYIQPRPTSDRNSASWKKGNHVPFHYGENGGRWPPNLVLSHSAACNDQCAPDCPVAEMDRQSGERDSRPVRPENVGVSGSGESRGLFGNGSTVQSAHYDHGTASRFFPRFRYCAKASRGEREAGLEGERKERWSSFDGQYAEGRNPQTGERTGNYDRTSTNHHPTVKPTSLMAWLVTLICPPGGLVLDPFTGSGTTGVACVKEARDFIGIEQDPEYAEIARARITHEQRKPAQLDLLSPGESSRDYEPAKTAGDRPSPVAAPQADLLDHAALGYRNSRD
jgi:site-specific DNA-methyltransferase (adenine-specific)